MSALGGAGGEGLVLVSIPEPFWMGGAPIGAGVGSIPRRGPSLGPYPLPLAPFSGICPPAIGAKAPSLVYLQNVDGIKPTGFLMCTKPGRILEIRPCRTVLVSEPVVMLPIMH